MSDDGEVDLELLELLRQSLGITKHVPNEISSDTGVLKDAQFIYNNAIDVSVDMLGTKAAAVEIYRAMQKRSYSSEAWSQHDLHPKASEGFDETDILNFVFTMDLLNFSFWSDLSENERFQVEYKGKRWTGYNSLVACLRRALDEGIPITTPRFWQSNQCSGALLVHIFRSATKEQIPLLSERIDILRDASRILSEDFTGPEKEIADIIPSASDHTQTILPDLETGTDEKAAKSLERPCHNIEHDRADGHSKADLQNPQATVKQGDAQHRAGLNVDRERSTIESGTDTSLSRPLMEHPPTEPLYPALGDNETRAIASEVTQNMETEHGVGRGGLDDHLPPAVLNDSSTSDPSISTPNQAQALHDGTTHQYKDIQPDDSVVRLVERATQSAGKLVNLLAKHFPSFRDEHHFDGRRVRIMKRAQIFVADLWAALDGHGIGEFHDIEQLTMFADYRVPQCLHSLGVLSYSPPLDHHIHSRKQIQSGHPWEVQLRGCSIWAVELIRREIVNAHPEAARSVNAVLIDFFLYDLAKEREAEGESNQSWLAG